MVRMLSCCCCDEHSSSEAMRPLLSGLVDGVFSVCNR